MIQINHYPIKSDLDFVRSTLPNNHHTSNVLRRAGWLFSDAGAVITVHHHRSHPLPIDVFERTLDVVVLTPSDVPAPEIVDQIISGCLVHANFWHIGGKARRCTAIVDKVICHNGGTDVVFMPCLFGENKPGSGNAREAIVQTTCTVCTIDFGDVSLRVRK
jgi:hypothetical protein